MNQTGPAEPAAGTRWRILALLALAELLGMALWFSASSVADQLAARWGMSPTQVGWLSNAVQLGFVFGTATAALLNLADILPARRYFTAAALLGAAANASLLLATDAAVGLALRFLTGFCLAGVYPPAMKMVASWFRERRGLAIGMLIGALTLGKASPYLVNSISGREVSAVVLTTSLFAVGAALLVGLFYRDGPHAFPRRPFRWGLLPSVLAHRETRLAIGGYLGHMWELYAMWIWTPAFLAASLAVRAEQGHPTPPWLADVLAFLTIAAGALGCLWGGQRADRIGRERLVNEAMAASGACCLLVGLCFGGPWWIVAVVTLLWGFFVVADSAQFSTLVTEVSPPHAVGTALTVQTSIGFLLTMASIDLVERLANGAGWALAFPALAIGPALGICSILLLVRLRRSG